MDLVEARTVLENSAQIIRIFQKLVDKEEKRRSYARMIDAKNAEVEDKENSKRKFRLKRLQQATSVNVIPQILSAQDGQAPPLSHVKMD